MGQVVIQAKFDLKKQLPLQPFAVGADGQVTFADLPLQAGNPHAGTPHSLIFFLSFTKVTEKKQQHVTVKTIDNVLKNLNLKKIDFVKIDVEGAEYEVLLGAAKSLRYINYILIEKQFTALYKGYSFKKIEKILNKKKFLLVKKFKFIIPFFEDRLYKKI